MAELARRLKVPRDWLERRVRDGTIAIARDVAMPPSTPLPPIWRRLPIDRRRRLAVLIGRMAWRRLDPARAAPPAEPPGEERADGTPNPPGEDQRPPP